MRSVLEGEEEEGWEGWARSARYTYLSSYLYIYLSAYFYLEAPMCMRSIEGEGEEALRVWEGWARGARYLVYAYTLRCVPSAASVCGLKLLVYAPLSY
jgi:hypothetical protein